MAKPMKPADDASAVPGVSPVAAGPAAATPIRVMVVDDHTVVREGLCRLLEAVSGFQVVGQAGTIGEAMECCRNARPDVMVLDFNLGTTDALAVLDRIATLEIRPRVLVLTMYGSDEYAARVLKAGAHGFVLKGGSSDELIGAIRKVAAGGTFVPSDIQERLLLRLARRDAAEVSESALSNREMQVLVMLARGEMSRQVAESLHLSLSTVETYRSRILEKLNLRNNSDLTRFAIERGLVEGKV